MRKATLGGHARIPRFERRHCACHPHLADIPAVFSGCVTHTHLLNDPCQVTNAPFVNLDAPCLSIKAGEHLGDHAQYHLAFLDTNFTRDVKVNAKVLLWPKGKTRHGKMTLPKCDPAKWWLYKNSTSETVTYRRASHNEVMSSPLALVRNAAR